MAIDRQHWLHPVKETVPSRHYTWLPQGLGGESVEDAMAYLTTDIMHVCKSAGISFDDVLDQARQRFEQEEHPVAAPDSNPPPQTRRTRTEIDGDEIVTAFDTEDMYDAEIVRWLLQSEGIACRLDSQSQGGFTELVTTKVLVHARDTDRAHAAIHRKPKNVEKPER